MATSTSAPLGSRGGHLVFSLVLVGQALLLSSQVTTEAGHSALRALLIGLFSPIQRGADAGLGAVSSLWYGYVDLRGVRVENGRLKEEVARLEQALWMERDVVASYRRLSAVLDLAERIPGNPVVAEVVGLDASAWFQTVTVNRGTSHGVDLNAPVIAAGGLVGRVISVGKDVAQIQLLTDRDCSVGALLARTRARGVVAGSGGEVSPTGLTLNYVSNLEDVVEGDLIVTSGMDGIYPKGIAIGRVASVRNGPRLFKLITVEPAANLDRLEEVFILEAASLSEITERVE
jgi:rod shape-determining protein MreC